MRRRIIAVVSAAVLVLALAAVSSEAMAEDASGPSREQAVEAGLDHPHGRRPAAASDSAAPVSPVATINLADPAKFSRATRDAHLRHFYEAVRIKDLERFYDGLRARDAQIAAAQAAREASRHRSYSSAPRSSSGGGGSDLDCIRHRESRGNYGAVNGSSGAAGAYQFMPGTWNSTARSAGRNDLVGVNPAQASASDQDAMASHLAGTQGYGPWGGGC